MHIIRKLGKKTEYHIQLKEKRSEKYSRSVFLILENELNGRNKMKSLNNFANHVEI